VNPGFKANQVPKDWLETFLHTQPTPTVSAVTALLDHAGLLDQRVNLDPRDHKDHRDPLVNLETMAAQDLRDLRDHKERRDQMAAPDPRDQRAMMDSVAKRGPMDLPDLRDPKDQRDLVDHQVPTDNPDPRVAKDHRDLKEARDNLDGMLSLVLRAHRDHLEKMPATAHAHAETKLQGTRSTRETRIEIPTKIHCFLSLIFFFFLVMQKLSGYFFKMKMF